MPTPPPLKSSDKLPLLETFANLRLAVPELLPLPGETFA